MGARPTKPHAQEVEAGQRAPSSAATRGKRVRQPFSCWLKIDRDQNGKRPPDNEKTVVAGCGLDLRSDMGGFDALFTTDERAHYRFAEGTSQGGM